MAFPILVTGAHRSGTTWVGKIISNSFYTYYLGEIFNPDQNILDAALKTRFRFIPVESGSNSDLYMPLKKILHYDFYWPNRKGLRSFLPSYLIFLKHTRRLFGWPRPVMKDPIAVLSSEWLASSFQMQVVCLIRHPAAFVYSLIKANWIPGFKVFLNQPLLIENHLNMIADKLNKPPSNNEERCALMWLCLNTVLSTYIQRHPDWMVIKLEDLSNSPIEEFSRIFSYLGIPFTTSLRNKIMETSNEKNPVEHQTGNTSLINRNSKASQQIWRQHLTSEQITRIRNIVESISCNYYSDVEW